MTSVDFKYFYVRRGEEIYGPATPNQLIAAAREGAVHPTDEIGLSWDGPWRPASTCVELGFAQASARTPEDDEEKLFVWEGTHRRGPISTAQLRQLLEWDLVALETRVSDEAGRMTTAGVVLQLVEEPPPEAPAPPPASTARRSAPPKQPEQRTPTPKPAPPQRPPARERRPTSPPKPPPPRTNYPDLEKLVQMERAAAAQKSSSTGGRSTGGSHDLPADVDYERAARRVVGSDAFDSAYQTLAVVISLQAAVYLTGMTALAGVYLSRIFFLCLEVFVPFEAATEHLEGSDLMLAGVALATIIFCLVLPLFFILKTGADFRLWGAATVLGLVLSQAVGPDGLARVGAGVRWTLVICGFVTAGIGIWITSLNANGTVIAYGATAVVVTTGAAVALTFVSFSGVLDVQVQNLPPTLHGSNPKTAVAAVCLIGQWLALPLFCASLMYPQADESTRGFMNSYRIGAAVLAVAGLLSLGFLVGHPTVRFFGAALQLLPFAAGGAMCGVLQALMWYLQPAYVARRTY